MFEFYVVGGSAVGRLIADARPEIIEVVRATYLAHHAGRTVNPDSYFLRFPDKPDSRIIALPSYLAGEDGAAGIKWIASFPQNIKQNLPRASAVLLINDYRTGHPRACMEASQISAARTAASAVLAAETILGRRRAGHVAVIGAGVIARSIIDFFTAAGWVIQDYIVHDLAPDYAQLLGKHIAGTTGARVRVAPSVAEAVRDAELVVLATTAATPYLHSAFQPGQVVLNISLRDVAAEVILASDNIVDDVEHCLKANTSPHLAEQQVGNREFINGTLAQLLCHELELTDDRAIVFSPFGLGVLDLAVGRYLLRQALERDLAVNIEGFFGETERWSTGQPAGPAQVAPANRSSHPSGKVEFL
ncbi:MAG: 2,3-diaminopropionate biosynthesis protein SbnB [Jatrophihabitantaceae bacterium]